MGTVQGKRRNRIYPTGEDHPRWKGGSREKSCQHCGGVFRCEPPMPYTIFKAQKFCSKKCADEGGLRHSGKDHPNYKANGRRRQPRGKMGAWSRKVLSRDEATCQECGAKDVELHAHHIKPFETYPELRWDVDNGLTLCFRCHWAVHTALDANGVNSGNTVAGNAAGNPEPSFGRKPVEGVTTRGQAYRRWNGTCDWCGTFISKRWSDAKGKKNLFCGYRCSGKYRAAHKSPESIRKQVESRKRTMAAKASTAVISSKSAPHESDDIV